MPQSSSVFGSDLVCAGAPSFRKQGYWVGKRFIDPDLVESTRREMHEVFRQQLVQLGIRPSSGSDEAAMHADMALLLHADKGRYLASLRLCAKLTSLMRLYLTPSLYQFATSIGIKLPVFQTAPVFHVISRDLRIPGGYYGYGAHQDWPALQSGLDTVTMWIPFVSVDASNYTLDIVPRSHLNGLLPGSMGQNAFETSADAYRESDFISIEADPGDVLFMSCFVLHRSSLQGGDRMRIATSMRYENGSDPYFVSNSYPFVHKRVVERDFVVKELPTPDEVRNRFGI